MLVFIYFLPEVLMGESPVHFVKLLSLRCLRKWGWGWPSISQTLATYCAPSSGLRTSEVSITYSFLTQSQSSHSSHFPNKGAERKKGAKLLA